jgi:hypothetical protein
MFGLDQLDSLPGRAFPGGSFLITAQEDTTMRGVVGAPPRAGDVAHPVWMFAGPQRAMGISIDDLFGWCGSSATEGPMLGETQLAMPEPLLIERRYAVTGGIVAATRKQGRRAGVFDIVTFELNVTAGDAGAGDAGAPGPGGGDPAGGVTGWQCRTSFVFPRRS